MSRTAVLAAIAACITLAGCASPPPFTGNGTGIHLQGGTATRDFYVRNWAWSLGQWQGYCDQGVYDAAGRQVGWYVDDSVNYYGAPPAPAATVSHGHAWSIQANCVAWDRRFYPGLLVIAGIPDKRTGWSFAPWHARNAQEWYPFCGSRRRLGAPPPRKGWIVQWNFTWKGCPATPYHRIQRLLRTIARTRPSLILFY